MLEEIAEKENVLLIEDAAQGFGGSIRSRKSMLVWKCCFNKFFPAKPLGCYGDGGAIFTNDNDLASTLNLSEFMEAVPINIKILRWYKWKIDTIQAAILLEKLLLFDEELIFRNNIASYYSKEH